MKDLSLSHGNLLHELISVRSGCPCIFAAAQAQAESTPGASQTRANGTPKAAQAQAKSTLDAG